MFSCLVVYLVISQWYDVMQRCTYPAMLRYSYGGVQFRSFVVVQLCSNAIVQILSFDVVKFSSCALMQLFSSLIVNWSIAFWFTFLVCMVAWALRCTVV
jgi:hypothetical protein